eukprot:2735165-Rhodomonas_salina.1
MDLCTLPFHTETSCSPAAATACVSTAHCGAHAEAGTCTLAQVDTARPGSVSLSQHLHLHHPSRLALPHASSAPSIAQHQVGTLAGTRSCPYKVQ